MTLQTQLVLRALLEDPAKERYGLELCELAGLPSGVAARCSCDIGGSLACAVSNMSGRILEIVSLDSCDT